jgi:hypothetical protein
LCVAFGKHALNQLLLMRLETSPFAPSAHGAAQLVRLAGREVRGRHRNLHDLFLEKWYAQRPFGRGANFSEGYSTASSPARRRRYG